MSFIFTLGVSDTPQSKELNINTSIYTAPATMFTTGTNPKTRSKSIKPFGIGLSFHNKCLLENHAAIKHIVNGIKINPKLSPIMLTSPLVVN